MSEHRLGEIVIERPRGGMRLSSRKIKGQKKQLYKLTQEAEQDGLFNPFLIKPRIKSKYLSDHLGPLRRFLRSKVGQPWNDIYSELSQRLDRSTIAGQHVIDHLWDFVELHVRFIDGIPHGRGWRGYEPLGASWRDRFYVDPKTGLLCSCEKIPRKQQRSQPQHDRDRNIVVIDDYNHYQNLNNIWYLITFEPFPPSDTVRDVFHGTVNANNAARIRGEVVYAARKRQCNKKEIRFILSQLP